MTPLELIIGPQVPIGTNYFDTNQVTRGKVHGRAFPAIPPTGAALDPYLMMHYYDLGQNMATAHARTQDPEFLTLFEKVCDSWWKTVFIDEGRNRYFDGAPAGSSQPLSPKFLGLGGLILRAAKRPEMWDWLNACTRYNFNNWLKNRINDPILYLGAREGAFSLQYAIWLSQALPDSFPALGGGVNSNGAQLRAQYLADAEAVCLNYFGRLQYPDGSWRWDDPYYVDADGGNLKGIMQPFMVGLLLDALTDVHRVSTNETVKASCQKQITSACRHLYLDGPYRKSWFIKSLGVYDRGFHYFFHGGTTVNPTKYEKGSRLFGWDTTDPSDVQNDRQAISTILAGFGYAYQLTKDEFFKLAGDELWDSAYGETDKVRNYMAGDAKSYNQNCRRAGSYKAWAGGVIAPTPAPAPVPSPTPTPTPTPPTSTTSPDGTKGTSITDAQAGVWTFGTEKQTLRNNVHMGQGAGVMYKWSGGIVYVLATDNKTWYRWIDGWIEIGQQEPGGVIAPAPAPTPAPAPAPTPTPTPAPQPAPAPAPSPAPPTGPAVGSLKTKQPWGTTDVKRKAKAKEYRALGYYFYGDETGEFATLIYTGVKIAT